MSLNILKERHVQFLSGLGYDEETLTKIDSAILNMNARVPAARLRKEVEEDGVIIQEELIMDNPKATVLATLPTTPTTPETPKTESEPVDPANLPTPQTVPGVLPTPKTLVETAAEPVDLEALADKVLAKMGYMPMFNQAGGGMGQRPPQQQGPPQQPQQPPQQPPAQEGGGELQQFMQQMSEVIAQIMAEIQGLKAQMGGVVKEAAETSKQLAKEQTPKLSFSEMLQKSIENQGTPLDGRSALVKDKPLETKAAPNAVAGSGFLGKLVQMGSGVSQ